MNLLGVRKNACFFAKFLSDEKEKLKPHIATVANGKAISIYRKEFKYMYDLSETETEAFTEIQDSEFDIADVVALRKIEIKSTR